MTVGQGAKVPDPFAPPNYTNCTNFKKILAKNQKNFISLQTNLRSLSATYSFTQENEIVQKVIQDKEGCQGSLPSIGA